MQHAACNATAQHCDEQTTDDGRTSRSRRRLEVVGLRVREHTTIRPRLRVGRDRTVPLHVGRTMHGPVFVVRRHPQVRVLPARNEQHAPPAAYSWQQAASTRQKGRVHRRMRGKPQACASKLGRMQTMESLKRTRAGGHERNRGLCLHREHKEGKDAQHHQAPCVCTLC